MALAAVHQRIGKAAQMTGSYPCLGVHKNGGVEPDVIGVLTYKLLPPGFFDVVLQLNAQGAIVPGVGQTAVNLTAGKDETAVLAEGDDLFHGLFGIFHVQPFLQRWRCDEF